MLELTFATGKPYGVFGLGKSGRAVVEALLYAGASVSAWDDKDTTRAALQKDFPALQVKPPLAWPWETLAGVVISPGVPIYHPVLHPVVAMARKHKVEILGDIDLLTRAAPAAQVIGITGTNGKSTTTALIGHILASCGMRAEVGGNIGMPVMHLPALAAQEQYVLELSSYQLDLMKMTHVNVAVWLNISTDHVDHHGTMDAYVEAKRHIFNHQKKRDVAVIAVDDPVSAALCKELQAGRQQSVIPISAQQVLKSGVFVHKGILVNSFGLQEMRGDISRITSLQGTHNWQNAAAAYAACFSVGCRHEAIIAAMQTYPGLPHRMQWLGTINDVLFVNDSKATNADAAEKALTTYDNIFWIAGGVAKDGGIAPLAAYFSKVRHAYLIGEAAAEFARTLEGHVPYTQCGTLENAFAAATRDASAATKKQPTVLLAPACASFDQYPNFEVRGDAFMQLVEAHRAAQA